MQVPSRLQDFWRAFASTQPSDPTDRFLEAFHFDDNEISANELAALVLTGTKRATTALLWGYEKDNKPIPRPGDLSIVTNFAGQPVCVIETTSIEILPFEEIGAEFASIEGEGDGSLAYWRRAHEVFFGRECSRIGRSPGPHMPVVCEQFQVVFPAASNLHSADPSASPNEGLASLSNQLPQQLGATRLRRFEAADLAAFQHYRSDPELARFQSWSVMTDGAARGFIDEMAEVSELRPGDWIQIAIADAASNRLIGDVGMHLSEHGCEGELGFTLCREAHGQGHASAAARLATGLFFRCSMVELVLGVTDARNTPSVGVLVRSGFEKVREQQAVFKGEHCTEVVFACRRPEVSR